MDTLHFVILAVILAAPVIVATFGYAGPYAVGGFPFYGPFSNGYSIQPYLGSPFHNVIPNGLPPLQVPTTASSRLIYSYQNKYESGGRSEVVFVTGAGSRKLMQDSMEILKTSAFPELISLSSNITNNSLSLTINPQLPSLTNVPQVPPSNSQPSTATVYRFQSYPSFSYPYFGVPIPLQSLLSFQHTTQHSATPNSDNTESNSGEAEESMISEVGIAAPSDVTVRAESNGIEAASTASPNEEISTAPAEEASSTVISTTPAADTSSTTAASESLNTSEGTSTAEAKQEETTTQETTTTSSPETTVSP